MRKNRTRMQENAKVQAQAAYTTESDQANIDENNTKAFDNIEVW